MVLDTSAVSKKKPGRSLRQSKKVRRTIFLLPSFFTVGNIFAGFCSVVATLHGNYGLAAVAIGIAVVLDGVDGRLARMTGSTSDFGLQLDSLADVISFGIAPALLVYSWGLEDFGNFARFSAFVFLICGTMRLARFNAQVQELKHFAGLPIPAGAGMIAATVHFLQTPPDSNLFKILLVMMTYGLSFLMISTIRYPSLKQLNLSRGKSHLNILLLAVLVAGVVWYSQQALILIASVYVASGLAGRVYQYLKYRLRDSKPLGTEEAGPD